MKLDEKFEIGEAMFYVWRVEDVKTEEACMNLMFKIAKSMNGSKFYFRGYSDMDTHENEAHFETVEDVKKGADTLKKIDPSNVKFSVGTAIIRVDIVNSEKGTTVTVRGQEDAVKKASAKIKQIVG